MQTPEPWFFAVYKNLLSLAAIDPVDPVVTLAHSVPAQSPNWDSPNKENLGQKVGAGYGTNDWKAQGVENRCSKQKILESDLGFKSQLHHCETMGKGISFLCASVLNWVWS